MVSVMTNRKTDDTIVNNRLALDASKKIRSIQYSTSQMTMDEGMAGCAHNCLEKMPQNSMTPNTAQAAPVMDRYSGLRRAPNSERTCHPLNAPNNRSRPHTDRLNTIQRKRVTPKGRLCRVKSSSKSESTSGCV